MVTMGGSTLGIIGCMFKRYEPNQWSTLHVQKAGSGGEAEAGHDTAKMKVV